MFRRVLSLLAVLTLLTGLPAAAAEAEESISQIAFAENDLYFLTGGRGLVHRSLTDGSEEILLSWLELSEACQQNTDFALFSYEDSFGIADWAHQKVFRWQNGALQPLAELQNAPGLENTYGVRAICENRRIWMLVSSVLMVADLDSGLCRQMNGSGLREINDHPDGGIIALRDSGDKTEIVRIASPGAAAEKLAELSSPSDGFAAIDPKSGILYASVDGMLSRWQNGQWQPINPLGASVFRLGCAIRAGRMISLAMFRLNETSLTPAETTPLNIVGVNPFLDNDDLFMRVHPNIAVRRVKQSYRPKDLHLALTSGDDETDLFVLYLSTGLLKLMDKGYLPDLAEASDAIKSESERWYPFVRDACTRNGKLYAFADQLTTVGGWRVQERYAALTPPATVAELMAFDRAWQSEDHAEPAVAYTFTTDNWSAENYASHLLMQWIMAHDPQDIRFSDPQLAELLQQAAEMPRIRQEHSVDEACNAVYSAEYSMNLYGVSEGAHAEATLMLPPSAAEGMDVHVPARLRVYVLNPRSQHRQEALLYLEYIASHRIGDAEAFLCADVEAAIRPNVQDQLTTMEQRVKDAQAMVDAAKEDELTAAKDRLNERELELEAFRKDRSNWNVYPDTLRAYRELYTPRMNLRLSPLLEGETYDGLWDELQTLLAQYLSGQSELDACLARMDDLWRMYRLENE